MDLKDITMEMVSERPTTTTKFSRELIDVLANPENTITQSDPLRPESMSLDLLGLGALIEGKYRIDHWGEYDEMIAAGFGDRLPEMIPPTETVTATKWFETDTLEPGEWMIVMWSDPDTGSTRMTGIIHDSHCHPYLVKII